jgi:hypothetical protein
MLFVEVEVYMKQFFINNVIDLSVDHLLQFFHVVILYMSSFNPSTPHGIK